ALADDIAQINSHEPVWQIEIVGEIAAHFGERRKPARDFEARPSKRAGGQQRFLDSTRLILFGFPDVAGNLVDRNQLHDRFRHRHSGNPLELELTHWYESGGGTQRAKAREE